MCVCCLCESLCVCVVCVRACVCVCACEHVWGHDTCFCKWICMHVSMCKCSLTQIFLPACNSL